MSEDTISTQDDNRDVRMQVIRDAAKSNDKDIFAAAMHAIQPTKVELSTLLLESRDHNEVLREYSESKSISKMDAIYEHKRDAIAEWGGDRDRADEYSKFASWYGGYSDYSDRNNILHALQDAAWHEEGRYYAGGSGGGLGSLFRDRYNAYGEHGNKLADYYDAIEKADIPLREYFKWEPAYDQKIGQRVDLIIENHEILDFENPDSDGIIGQYRDAEEALKVIEADTNKQIGNGLKVEIRQDPLGILPPAALVRNEANNEIVASVVNDKMTHITQMLNYKDRIEAAIKSIEKHISDNNITTFEMLADAVHAEHNDIVLHRSEKSAHSVDVNIITKPIKGNDKPREQKIITHYDEGLRTFFERETADKNAASADRAARREDVRQTMIDLIQTEILDKLKSAAHSKAEARKLYDDFAKDPRVTAIGEVTKSGIPETIRVHNNDLWEPDDRNGMDINIEIPGSKDVERWSEIRFADKMGDDFREEITNHIAELRASGVYDMEQVEQKILECRNVNNIDSEDNVVRLMKIGHETEEWVALEGIPAYKEYAARAEIEKMKSELVEKAAAYEQEFGVKLNILNIPDKAKAAVHELSEERLSALKGMATRLANEQNEQGVNRDLPYFGR